MSSALGSRSNSASGYCVISSNVVMENDNTPRYCWDKKGGWFMDAVTGEIVPIVNIDGYEDLPDLPPVPIRQSDPVARNNKLYELAENTAAAKRAEGAARAPTLPKAYQSLEHAKRVDRDRMKDARTLGKEACDLCQIRRVCEETEFDISTVVSQTKNNSTKRKNFRTNLKRSSKRLSLEKSSKTEDDDLCENMLKKPL